MSQELYDFFKENKRCMFSIDLISMQFNMKRSNVSTKMTKMRVDVDWGFLKEGRGPSKIFYFLQ